MTHDRWQGRKDGRTHTESVNVLSKSSSLQLGCKRNCSSYMYVRAFEDNLCHMLLCSRCGNDISLSFFKYYLFEARYIPFL